MPIWTDPTWPLDKGDLKGLSRVCPRVTEVVADGGCFDRQYAGMGYCLDFAAVVIVDSAIEIALYRCKRREIRRKNPAGKKEYIGRRAIQIGAPFDSRCFGKGSFGASIRYSSQPQVTPNNE
ncbi:hypothetical protein BKA70DRAFT_1243216 [Coprinopsis sp. MPI-PUGE-AT-0042]|nr:hypothetical protein BKA70DRAFT_1243216 [Coprinopsis sp. MPI-PUGE-AT-0042]